MITDDELNALTLKCRRYDRQSQEILYNTFYGHAEEYCRQYLNSQEDVIETVNRSFDMAFKYIDQYNTSGSCTISSFKKWFRKMTLYALVYCYRTRFNAFAFPVPGALQLQKAFPRWKNIQCLSPDVIERRIQLLPPSSHLLITLLTVYKLDEHEIADCLFVSTDTVKIIVSRATNQLKEVLEPVTGAVPGWLDVYGRVA